MAAAAITAESRASTCRLKVSPTDMVASSMKEGTGMNGTREPKKLNSASPRYPRPGSNGNRIDSMRLASAYLY